VACCGAAVVALAQVAAPPTVQVQALLSLQEAYDKLEAEYVRDVIALELRFKALFDPVLQKRSDVVSGRVDGALCCACGVRVSPLRA
jgi:hypothetical protein